MDRFAIVLLASAIGAAGGVFVMKTLDTQAGSSADAPAAVPSDLAVRLERIEAILSDRPEPLTLRGAAPAPGAFTPESPEGKAFIAAIAGQVSESTKEALAAAAEEAAPPSGEAPTRGRRRSNRKRMALTDVAKELELSSAEEQALKEVYEQSNDKLMKVLAGENGDTEEVRRDIEKIRENPDEAMAVMAKYIPRVTKDIGSFFSIRSQQTKGIRDAIGEDKAARLNREFVVEESDPLGMGGRGGRGFGFR